MNKIKKTTTVAAIVLAIGVTSVTGYAASIYKTPAEAAAGLTGKTVESVMAERQEKNKSYGEIANEAGKLDEFKKESIEIKKDRLDIQVESGRITREKADTIIKSIEEHKINCDGSGSQKIGREEEAKFGSNGLGQRLGRANKGQGSQHGHGKGQHGMRLQDGTNNTSVK